MDRDDPADILGYGGRVAGLSAIHRCRKKDNAAASRRWRFRGRGGRAGAEYGTYRESFVKVAAKERARGSGSGQSCRISSPERRPVC